VRERTGLPLDPYFSATKWEWMLANVPAVRSAASKGTLRLGTVDSWLAFRLTGRHVTDTTNASRTLLYSLHRAAWDPELVALFGLREEWLPEVVPSVSASGYGVCRAEPFGRPLPLLGCLGDQQSALFGHRGFSPGATKNTYGTGSFLLMNTGGVPRPSHLGLLTTVAYQLEGEKPIFGLEGSIFVTGAAIQWLRDGLGLIGSASETEALANSVPDNGGLYFVPAFAGLGAPYWDPRARGAFLGLTGAVTRAHVARAALEAMAYQTRDVVTAMARETGSEPAELRVDGGAVENAFLCQFQSDLLGVPVARPACREMTARGAAFAAGLACGFWSDLRSLEALEEKRTLFNPSMESSQADDLYGRWQEAVRRCREWVPG
jgi:glycerol kinase